MTCAALLPGLISGCSTIRSITPKGEPDTRIRISSEPSGAKVYLMGKEAGVTPLIISDQDIYPTSYNPAMEKYYGKVQIKAERCKEYSKRLTRSDVKNGLVAKLDCGVNLFADPSQQASEVDVPQRETATMPATVNRDRKTSPALRLQQLKSLQQLHDEGLLSAEEEEKLRRRIINAE